MSKTIAVLGILLGLGLIVLGLMGSELGVFSVLICGGGGYLAGYSFRTIIE